MFPLFNLPDLDRPRHPVERKFGRRPWGGSSSWKPHQNKRECARRLVQLAKGQLGEHVGLARRGTHFISHQARATANKLRLRAIGLYAPGDRLIVDRDDARR